MTYIKSHISLFLSAIRLEPWSSLYYYTILVTNINDNNLKCVSTNIDHRPLNSLFFPYFSIFSLTCWYYDYFVFYTKKRNTSGAVNNIKCFGRNSMYGAVKYRGGSRGNPGMPRHTQKNLDTFFVYNIIMLWVNN